MAIIPSYDVGDKVRIGNHAGSNVDGTARQPFKDVAGADTDPTAIKVRFRKLPDGTARVLGYPSADTDGLLVREAVGRFYTDYIVQPGDDGRWGWKLEGTGVITSADEGEFRVSASAF